MSGLKEEEYIVLLNNVYPGKVALNAAAAAAASDDTTTILSSLSTCSSKDLVSGEVFDLLDQTKSYSLLINTRHLGTLISHLIRGDRLDGLLLETIKAKRLKAASDLVYQFYQQHGDRLPLTEEEEEEEGDDDDAVLPNQLVVGTIDKFTREELTRIYLEQHPNLQRQVVVSSITDK